MDVQPPKTWLRVSWVKNSVCTMLCHEVFQPWWFVSAVDRMMQLHRKGLIQPIWRQLLAPVTQTSVEAYQWFVQISLMPFSISSMRFNWYMSNIIYQVRQDLEFSNTSSRLHIRNSDTWRLQMFVFGSFEWTGLNQLLVLQLAATRVYAEFEFLYMEI